MKQFVAHPWTEGRRIFEIFLRKEEGGNDL